jgi:thiol-disulfide isomerase/thioredoxin
MRLAIHTLLFASLLPVSTTLFAQAPASYKSNPKFQAALSDAKLLAENQDYDDAISSYQEANEIAGGKDKTCLRAILELQIANADYDDAIDTSHTFAAVASTPAEKSYAAASRGRALFLESEPQSEPAPEAKPQPAKPESQPESKSQYDLNLLNSAHTAFQAALAIDPKNSSALFTDGEVLAHLGQTEAARARFQACLATIHPDDPTYLRTQRFAKNPALALQPMTPPFSVTTLDGSTFNPDQMNGRVVLIDFWATWCGPCLKELPQIKQIAKDFAGQPLTILSISWDEDDQTWKDFLHKNGMTWPQYRDIDHKIGQLFDVEALPSYFTIDSDGVLTSELLGEGFDVEGNLRKLIAKAKAPQPSQASAPPPTTGNDK